MATTVRQEARALSADERELVDKSRPPVLRALTDTQLATLMKRLRDKRDRARTVAERQRREIRGKARPRGAAPIKADEGSKLKQSVLATALRRVDAETARRTREKAKTSMVASAKKALAQKQQAKRAAPKKTGTTRGAGKSLTGKARVTVENHVPASARGRVRKQVARAQAKRDARAK